MLICRWHNIGISHWARQVFGKGDQRPQNPGRFCETNSPIQQFLKKAKLDGDVSQADLHQRIVIASQARPRSPGALAEVLRPPTLCHGTPSQRGRSPGVPLRQTA